MHNSHPQEDRAVIDFGKVLNPDDPDKKITVHIVAFFIKNEAYTNDSAYVTVGAEYDDSNYIWVAQADYTFDMNPVSLCLLDEGLINID